MRHITTVLHGLLPQDYRTALDILRRAADISREAHADRLLIVPSAPGVVFQSIKVGDEEQLLAAGAPVELYSTAALTDAVPDNFSPLGPALDFIVTLQNTTAVAITGTIGIKAAGRRVIENA